MENTFATTTLKYIMSDAMIWIPVYLVFAISYVLSVTCMVDTACDRVNALVKTRGRYLSGLGEFVVSAVIWIPAMGFLLIAFVVVEGVLNG